MCGKNTQQMIVISPRERRLSKGEQRKKIKGGAADIGLGFVSSIAKCVRAVKKGRQRGRERGETERGREGERKRETEKETKREGEREKERERETETER